MNDPTAFLLALLFLVGLLLLLSSAFPRWRARWPGAFGWGFALATLAIFAMFIVALFAPEGRGGG